MAASLPPTTENPFYPFICYFNVMNKFYPYVLVFISGSGVMFQLSASFNTISSLI